jgi:Ca2+-binding EF-hand superfamily protein
MASNPTQVLKNFEAQLKVKIMQKNNEVHEAKFLQRQFKYFDIQNRGKVSFEQFCRAMEKTGIVMTN